MRLGREWLAAAAIAAVVASAGTDLVLIVVDAGSKVLGSDRPAWASGYGRVMECPEASITALSEHHATVDWPEDRELPGYGEQLRIIPNHVCVAVNLVDSVLAIHPDGAVERWDVNARGLNY